jgi:type I restriction enzyme S subunit
MENNPFIFGECATEVRDKVQPEGSNGAKYVGLEHIEQDTLHLNGFGSANDVSSTKSKFSKGDILFGKLRPYFRKVVRAPFDGVCSTDIWVVRSTNGIDQGFLYYWMASQEFVDFSMQGSEGTRMPRAKWDHVGRHQIPCFSEDEQKAIAHILGSLDDKIELNRRMNGTLEDMARAIFNSWFVDFDPVKAKMEGQQSNGVDKESRVLFPDSFLESDMGMIPEGWSVGVLGKVALNYRKSVKTQDIHSTIPYIGLEHMPRKSIALSSWGYSEKLASNKSEFVSGDFLFGKLRPYFHKVGIAVTDGVCSTDILVVRPIDEAFYGFVIMLISSDEFIEYTKRLSNGSKMPRTNWKDMGKYNIVIPPKELAQRFSDMVAPMFRKIKNNIAENKSLEGIRDTLLPKLISGELSVSAVEKQLEKVL